MDVVFEHPAASPGRPTSRAARPGNDQRDRRRLGDVLVDSGLITSEQLGKALEEQRKVDGPRRRIGQMVVDLGFATEREVAECLARLLHLKLVDLSRRTILPETVQLLPRAVAERTRVLPLEQFDDGRLIVAAADPTNVLALDDVRLHTRSTEIEVFVAMDSQISDQINAAWSLAARGDVADELETEIGETDEEEAAQATVNEDAPIVKLVNRILVEAVRTRASDIHIECERDNIKVRYRIDGMLRDITNVPKRMATSVTSRIKIISGLDIAERRVPQDGRTRFAVEGHAIDSRVSTLPSLHGEKVVIRLLTRGDAVPRLADLGLAPEQLETLEQALTVPQGLILITGPTGSGKTNTLYSAIAQIRSPEQNIVTLEDPIEVQLPGITQVQVNEKTGMTFSRGLRSILRQDPDIILVGEVRDTETAELALKAAMTGHMVLTTLHTNSATAALTRLVDMGAEPFLVASSLTAAVAQRLVRSPCPSCTEPYTPDPVTLTLLGLVPDDLKDATPRRGKGCRDCGMTGYRGRTGIYELLSVDSPMRKILMKDPSEGAILAQALASGMVTLRAAGILKARQGLTTFEEVVRVTQSDHVGGQSCDACGRPVESDMIACPWCAATLERGRCAECSKKLDPDWKVCPWCRTPTARQPQRAPSAAQQQAAQQVPRQAAPQQPAYSQQQVPQQPAYSQQQAPQQTPQRPAYPQQQVPQQPAYPQQQTPQQTPQQQAPPEGYGPPPRQVPAPR
jgi:type IV pilus assembly protein PilB